MSIHFVFESIAHLETSIILISLIIDVFINSLSNSKSFVYGIIPINKKSNNRDAHWPVLNHNTTEISH